MERIYKKWWSPAVKISLLYIVFGFLWIIWSDWLFSLWFTDYSRMLNAQTHKGWFYVAITATMLFFLIRSSLREVEETKIAFTLKLQDSERQLSNLMSNLPGMAFRCCNDKYWTMLFVSRGCEKLTGYKPEELINNSLLSYARIIHPEDRRWVLDEVTRNIDSRLHYQITYRIITKSSQVKWVSENGVGVFDDNHNLLFIEGLILDISIQKKHETTIQQHLDELERVNQELNKFTTNVAHDLMSPILAAAGNVDLLRRDLEDKNIESAGKSVQRIQKVIDKMRQLLEDLLKLARLGKVVDPIRMISMEEVVEEVKGYLDGLLDGLDYSFYVEPGLPDVYADRSRIVVVLQNLLENAVKFRQPGNPLYIHIGFSRSGDFPVFFIKDNGIGIDPRHHQQIFELFTRVDMKSHGSGVGLSMVERIIRSHGGKIWVRSEGERKGTAFFFSLPSKPPKE